VIAVLPANAYLLAIKLGNPAIVPPERFAALFSDASHGIPELAVIVMLGNGFIVTAMIWAAALAALIDLRPGRAATILSVGAMFTAFGVIHSVQPQGALYLPWNLLPEPRAMVAAFASAYVALAAGAGLALLARRSAALDRAAPGDNAS
jgi:AGZA family xanthine/uracil permease-like MFS transporter